MQSDKGHAMEAHQTGHLESRLAALAGGSVPAFVAVYRATGALVHATVLRIVRDPEHTDRAVVALYADLRRSASAFDPRRGSAATWLLALAHSRGLAALREAQAAAAAGSPSSAVAAARATLYPDHQQLLALALAGMSRIAAASRTSGGPFRRGRSVVERARAAIHRVIADGDRLTLCTPANGAIPGAADNQAHDM